MIFVKSCDTVSAGIFFSCFIICLSFYYFYNLELDILFALHRLQQMHPGSTRHIYCFLFIWMEHYLTMPKSWNLRRNSFPHQMFFKFFGRWIWEYFAFCILNYGLFIREHYASYLSAILSLQMHMYVCEHTFLLFFYVEISLMFGWGCLEFLILKLPFNMS